MRDARQRSILAGMGISLWVPRLARTRKILPASADMWRDQVVTGQIPVAAPVPATAIPDVVPVMPDAVQAGLQVQLVVEPVLTANPAESAGQLPATVAAVVAMQAGAGQDAVQTQSPLRFSVQAVELPHWILLIDEQSLQHAAARQLWANICAAFANPEPVRFNWPLADGLRWQHPQGAKAALNGFLFRMGMDKRIGLMGQLQDDIAPDRIERLPTLQELLEQPLKKRSLWSLLKQQ